MTKGATSQTWAWSSGKRRASNDEQRYSKIEKEELCSPSEPGFSLVISALLSASIAFAQSQNAPGAVTLKPSQEFRFISTTKTATFEKELNDWASKGLRFVSLAKAFNVTGLGGLLAREKEGESPKYEYKVLATNRLGTMKKELEAAAAEGFEFRGISSQEKVAPIHLPGDDYDYGAPGRRIEAAVRLQIRLDPARKPRRKSLTPCRSRKATSR